MSSSDQHRDAILAALEQLLAWPDMARSPQLSKFIEYIVRRKIDGAADAIKAYSIAVDVFGRSTEFDPQVDPIVRVQARRLRSLLDQYYAGVGQAAPVRIRLPVGRYVPDFIWQPEPQLDVPKSAARDIPRAPPRQVRLPNTWYILLGAALCFLVALYGASRWLPEPLGSPSVLNEPKVSVAEFVNLGGDERDGPPVAGLAIELVTDLEQFEDIEVTYAGGGLSPSQPASELRDDFSLTGIVRAVNDDFQYSAVLTDRRTDTVVWNHTVTVSKNQVHGEGVLDGVSQSIILLLGSPRGPLHAAARAMLVAGQPVSSPSTLYICRMIFNLYRETGGAADAERTRSCLANLSDSDAADATALAMSGALLSENASDPGAPADQEDRIAAAVSQLDLAIRSSSISAFVWEQHARFHEDIDARAMAEADYGSSIQLNPASTDALAAYARLLAFTGSLDEARPLIHSALAGEPSPPAWYSAASALLALVDENYPAALVLAERYANADRELGAVLGLVAGQKIGDTEVVNRFLPQVLEMESFRLHGILPRLETRITDLGVIALLSQGLVNAGVPEAALHQPF